MSTTGADPLDRRSRQDAVAQVEDVSRPAICPPDDVVHSSAQFGERCKESDRIEVSLNGTLVADPLPAAIERSAPVETKHLAACFGHCLEEMLGTHAKVNAGHTETRETVEERATVGQHVVPVVRLAQLAGPAVEDLQRLGAGRHLCDEEIGQHIGQLREQPVP